MNEYIYAPNTTIHKTWERTSALRWKANGAPFLDPFNGNIVTPGPILQQAYWCRETDETEWRSLEIVP